jgi:tetratricopeptide (TPR) repeat protein
MDAEPAIAQRGGLPAREPNATEMARLIAAANSGSPAELERTARNLSARYPQNGAAWKALGVALQMQGKDPLAALEVAAELAPRDAEALRNLGIAQWTAGQIDACMVSFQRAVALQPDATIYDTLGGVQRKLGRAAEAVKSYRQALALEPASAEILNHLGDTLRELRQPDEAAASLKRALMLQPDFAEAHNNLANALMDAGKLAQAVVSYRRAIELRPDVAEMHSNLGKALLDLRQLEAAIESCSRAVALNPALPEAHGNLGNALLDSDRPEQAIASYVRALALKADYPELHNSLANALRSLGRFDEALVHYRRALELRPDYAEAHNNLGVALRLLGRTSEAESSCRRALELEPNSALALAALGEAQADQGQFAEAEALLRRAVEIDPNLAEAWVSIARLRRMTADDADWLAQVQRLLRQPLRPREVISANYALGKYFDDQRDFEHAFSHYQRANELTRLRMPRYDGQRIRREIDQLSAFFDAGRMCAPGAAATTSVRSIFVVGMPRSGTSLAEQIIASHPAVFGAGELTYWHRAEESLLAEMRAGDIPSDTLQRLAADYSRLLQRAPPGSQYVVDKMPTNFMALGLIHAALPHARIIHMRRHPIDTCLSIYFQDFGANMAYANDLHDLADFYREYLRLMRHWRTVLPAQTMLDVPYEALVADQEGWSRKMLEFIGLPWDARCLEFHSTRRSVVTASKWQVRQKINSTSVGRWRHYEQHLAPLLPLLSTE